ncbi:hypothetical protein L218DRAFT_956715 [Marasmius fiardii PR-910]|nr:hypothetical protein L218DRAFT_956715 [Marasmius fiardii PR-910]
MSGIAEANWAAAASFGLDNETTSTFATALGLIHILQVYTSCMVTLAVWDWLSCLKMEWMYIWKRQWTLMKCLYLWTRYYGLLAFALNLWLFNDNFTAEQCKTLHYIIAATCMWVTLGSEAILAVRTYAFLGKGKVLGGILALMLLAETSFLLYVSIAGVHQTPQVFPHSPCTASDAPGKHIVSGFWLAPVAFDLICTFFTVYKAFQLYTVGVKNPIVGIFLREGVLYFLAVAFVNVLNAAFMFQSNANIQNINCFLALVLSQVLCCRLVLNLRASRDSGSASSYSVQSGTHPVFNPNGGRGTESSGISIPLSTIGESYSEEMYSGVKVQVDVQRDSDHARKEMV